ncbi:MAG: MmgE/PrpD family protein [Pseudomonadota bacterium]
MADGAVENSVETGATAALAPALARFATALPAEALSETALAVARLSLLDFAAVALAGRQEPVARILRGEALRDGGRGEAGIIGGDPGARVPARAAAMTNGATGHALDYDDTHFGYVGHPSVAVFPAALAMAEAEGRTGREALEAALIGMEAACRVGAWLGTQHYNHGFHQTATAGAFGATLAAARLLGLDAETAAMALGIAATRASGLKSQFGTMGKPLNAGIAAANGIECARLAAAGLVSRPEALDGPQGFGETHAGENAAPSAVLDGLGERWQFEAVSHKFHACCHGLHAMLEALGALWAGGLSVAELSAVIVTVNPRWLRVCNIERPATGLEAKFSYRLTAAMALTGRDTGALESYSDAACADPDLLALRERVSVETDPSIADTAAQVVIHCRDGTTRDAAHDLAAAEPLSVRSQKVRAKAGTLLGEAHAGAITARIEGFAGDPAPFTLMAFLAEPRQ